MWTVVGPMVALPSRTGLFTMIWCQYGRCWRWICVPTYFGRGPEGARRVARQFGWYCDERREYDLCPEHVRGMPPPPPPKAARLRRWFRRRRGG
nr:hypothetical protein GCM10020241_10970 [Streptoalloteichus tenebrarius]